MSGHADNNLDMFSRYAKKLRDQGYTVMSPGEFNLPEGTVGNRANWMRRDIHALLYAGTPLEIDAIAMMPGYLQSSGGLCELMVAQQLQKELLWADTMTGLYLGNYGYNLPRVIGLNGYICAGKDYLASALIAEGYRKVSFSDALKDMVAEQRGVTREYLDEHKGEFRTDLQRVGEGKRQENPSYWIDILLDKLKTKYAYDNVVINDCRHPNESTALLDAGHFVIKVCSPDAVREKRIKDNYGELTETQRNHISETGQRNTPFSVMLPGTLRSELVISSISLANLDWQGAGCPRFCEALALTEPV